MILTELIAEKLDCAHDYVKLSSLFKEDFEIDSLDEIELIMACEDEYDVEISDEEAQDIKSVSDAAKLLLEKGVAADKLGVAGLQPITAPAQH